MAAIPILVCSSRSKLPPRNPNPTSCFCFTTGSLCCCFSRRKVILTAAVAVTLPGSGKASSSTKTAFDGISNTKSWFQFYGDGFSIRVPPLFEDIMEPEDFSAGQTFYGDKAKPKTFAARFASLDRSEVLSVMIRPSNQLKITFLEAKDITDIGSLKESSKIFVPGDIFRTYYFYEFGLEEQHVALAAGISSGKAYVAGAAAPQAKWEDDGVVLRSAALSLTVL
ncbi:hypothetical protein AXF42_Ash008553 [Apostasia shenzhenica]|uniref:PsbP C-terminal domain-containing protein n=1 Tax=Apostasia shenzhenica TaxID=1088818 RepID=A0A2I0B1Q1_9ASPA|nr:hypothetical protein AXF42_Ash008553 [Apostasia shenzhenica]